MPHIAGHDRSQLLLLPESLDDYVGPENPVRFIEAFVDGLDLAWVRGRRAHAAGVATDNPLNSLVFGIDRSAKHSKILDTPAFQ